MQESYTFLPKVDLDEVAKLEQLRYTCKVINLDGLSFIRVCNEHAVYSYLCFNCSKPAYYVCLGTNIFKLLTISGEITNINTDIELTDHPTFRVNKTGKVYSYVLAVCSRDCWSKIFDTYGNWLALMEAEK